MKLRKILQNSGHHIYDCFVKRFQNIICIAMKSMGQLFDKFNIQTVINCYTKLLQIHVCLFTLVFTEINTEIILGRDIFLLSDN